MKPFQIVTLSILAASAALADAPQQEPITDPPVSFDRPEILTVRPDGSFSNTNVVGNLAGFAEAKAASLVAEGVATAAYTAATNTQKIVRDGIAEIQAGAKIEYSDLFVWSAGAFSLSTNATCNIYNITLHPEVTTNISSVVHFAVDIKYWFSEDIGSYQPGVKYSTNLNATNSWEMCVQDDAVGPFIDTTPQGLVVQNAYLTRNYLPVSLKSSFFKAFTDSAAPGTGMTIDIVGGVKGGLTGEIVIPPTGKTLTIKVIGGIITELSAEDAQ